VQAAVAPQLRGRGRQIGAVSTSKIAGIMLGSRTGEMLLTLEVHASWAHADQRCAADSPAAASMTMM